MSKKAVRVISIILAALMLLTTVSLLFAQLAFAAESGMSVIGEPVIKRSDETTPAGELDTAQSYTITLTVQDEHITADQAADFKNAQVEENGGDFTFKSEGALIERKNTSGSDKQQFTITLQNVRWNGGGNELRLSLSYEYGSGQTSGGEVTANVGELPPVVSTGEGYRWYRYPEFCNSSGNGSPLRTLSKGKRYQVDFQFVDNSVNTAEIKANYNKDGNFIGYEIGEVSVQENGGDFIVIADPDSDSNNTGTISSVGDSNGSPILNVSFYAKLDGSSNQMSLDIQYSYEGTDGVWHTSTGTLEKRISEVRIRDNSSSSEDEENETYLTATPNIIITEYSYGGTDVLAGKEFPLTVTFQNTSDELTLENIILDLVTSTGLAISSGSNSAFLETLGPGESQTRTFKMLALANLEKIEPQQITAKFTYEYILDKARKTGERTEVLAVPVTQVDRFEIGELSVPDQLFPGETTYFTIDYVNKGKGTISNLAAKLETNVPGVGGTQNIGNIASGESGTIDFDMSINDSGTVEGKVIVTYENLSGEEITEELPFTTTVMDLGGGDMDIGTFDPMPMPAEEETGLPLSAKIIAAIGGIMIAGLTGTVVVKKVKAKREEEQDEDI